MQRFQKALKSQLDKQNEKLSLELRELQEAVRNRTQERENHGVDLYGVQQELARHQMMLEKNHDQYASLQQLRSQQEDKLGDTQDMYRKYQFGVNAEKKKGKSISHIAICHGITIKI